MSKRHSINRERIFGLDAMRASAIIFVLLGHLTWIMPDRLSTWKQLFSTCSFLGVEIFFVLSGFLIGKILLREFVEKDFGFKQLRNFLKRRWFRTLPNYFLVLCANIFIAIAVIGYDVGELWRYFFFLQNFSNPMPAFFPESWSLSVEEFAYLLLPFALMVSVAFFRGIRKQKLFLITVSILYLVFIATKLSYSAAVGTASVAEWNLGLKSVVIYRIDAILTGVIAAWVSVNFERFWNNSRIFAAFLGILLGLLVLYSPAFGIASEKYSWFRNVAYLPFLSLSIALALPFFEGLKKAPNAIGKPISYIALISYAMYLLHYGIVLQLLNKFALEPLGWEFAAGLYFVLSIGLSALLFHFFEKPITDLRDSRKL